MGVYLFNSAGTREEQRGGGSYANVQEAGFIVFLVSQLLNKGLDGTEIGIICLYKAQETHIRDALQNDVGEASEMGGLKGTRY